MTPAGGRTTGDVDIELIDEPGPPGSALASPLEVPTRSILLTALTVIGAVAVTAALAYAVSRILVDDRPDAAAYRAAQADGRALGPTTGRLDDGTLVSAVSFVDEDGRVCALFGAPGERSDDHFCVVDTAEDVDAVNWEIGLDPAVDLTLVIASGRDRRIDFQHGDIRRGHGTNRFAVQDATVAVYVGPPWTDFVVEPLDPATDADPSPEAP